ncbi:MAG TPA: hypothetical protein VFR10_05215 [bacterium]|nr:hypothetical protein [bacterium]
MVRYDSTEARVYFRLQAYDESVPLPEIHYLDLNGQKPRRPIRASWLEPTQDQDGTVRNNPEWSELAKRSLVLKAIPDYRLSLDVHSDSLSVDPDWNVTRFTLSIRIEVGDAAGTLNLEAVCEPLVRVRGLYEIPGRPERIVLVSNVGRAYGCEEVDTLVLIPE